jgi:hypothetical protein
VLGLNGCACLLLWGTSTTWWNAEHCGDNPVHDYYQLAQASGNELVVTYEGNIPVTVRPWSQKSLNKRLVVNMYVRC